MRRYFLPTFGLLALTVLLLGCSSDGDPASVPVIQAPAKTANWFEEYNVIEIFGTQAPGDAVYNDVDSAGLILHGSDTPAVYSGRHWTAFVARGSGLSGSWSSFTVSPGAIAC